MGSLSKCSLRERRYLTFTFKMVDEAKVKYVCDIYDWDGKGEIDLFFLGDICYALGLNITKKACVGQGQTDEEGKKFAKYDDVVEKVKAAVATPDSQGSYGDYVELLKLYDKNSNGTMMLAELDNILCNLGDEVPKGDVQKLFAELCDPEDEDGLFPYMSFLDRLTGKAQVNSQEIIKKESTQDCKNTPSHN